MTELGNETSFELTFIRTKNDPSNVIFECCHRQMSMEIELELEYKEEVWQHRIPINVDSFPSLIVNSIYFVNKDFFQISKLNEIVHNHARKAISDRLDREFWWKKWKKKS